MAHKEIEWVQSKYKLAASILGILGIFIIGAAAYLIPKTIGDLKKEIKDEAEVTRSIIKREIDLHAATAKTELAWIFHKP